MSPVLAHWSAVWPAAAIYLAVAGAHLAGTLRGGLGGAAGRRAVIAMGQHTMCQAVTQSWSKRSPHSA